MSEKTKMRQSFNQVNIEGWMNSKTIKEGSKNEKDYISGKIEVRLDETNIIEVEMFANKFTKEGKENSIYKGIQTIDKEYVAATDVENWKEAQKVRVKNGQVRVNDFVKNNEVISAVKYGSNFMNRVTDEFNPHAKISLEIIFKGTREEMKNEEPTGRGYLDGFIVDYSGNMQPISFVVGEKIWNKIDGEFEKGETLYIACNIANTVETKTVKTEMQFGEDEEKVVVRNIKERVITGIKRVDSDEKIYSKGDIKEGMVKRGKFLEDLKTKNKFEENENKQGHEEIDDDSLPF